MCGVASTFELFTSTAVGLQPDGTLRGRIAFPADDLCRQERRGSHKDLCRQELLLILGLNFSIKICVARNCHVQGPCR